MNRKAFFKHFGVIKDHPDLDKITDDAYKQLERKNWTENLNSSPHGRPWHTSFHASGFPDKDKPCGRLALYTLMDIPQPEPASNLLVATGGIGQAVEYQIVYRWGLAGLTIGGSVPLWDGASATQCRFEDDSLWLTGSSDAILDLRQYGFDSVLPVDIKSKKTEVVQEMQQGIRSYEDKHYKQVQAYIYLAGIFHDDMGWGDMGLKPARSAFIYYASRENPRIAHAFYVERDSEFIGRNIELLQDWQSQFVNDTLPTRPKEWRWTEEPCKWCPMKKYVCKPDYKDGITDLRESNGVKFAKELRQYDYDKTKKEVTRRWQR